MTSDELKDFCVENAGKVASGKYRSNLPAQFTKKIVKGRIIGFMIDQFKQPLILLEDENGKENKDIPNPLPAIPHLAKGWFRVVSPSKVGFPVYAETVVVESEISDQIQATVSKAMSKAFQQDIDDAYIPDTVSKICMHNECDPTWCHRKYAGII